MSWVDKINTGFSIKTADGKSYTVDWMNATKKIEYFISEFNFPNLAGSLVNRGKPKGARYDIEIYFQGENNIEKSQEFRTSADDNSRPWVVIHPLYGQILAQPTSLEFDDNSYNVTKITGQLIETIDQDNPKTVIDPIDNILIQKENLDTNFTNSLTYKLKSQDVVNMNQIADTVHTRTIPILKLPDEISAYYNLFYATKSAINNAIQSPVVAMRTIQALISTPANFTTDVKVRLNSLSSQYDALKAQIVPKNSYQKINPSTKQVFQITGAALISAQLVAASTPLPNNYTNSTTVINVIETLIINYNTFLVDLDSIQTATGGKADSFIPDWLSFMALNELMNTVISNLFIIALNGKQERKILLDQDTNIVLLTHKLYGLDEFDNNIDELMANNGWGLNQCIQIRKNTEVKYYI